MLETPRYQFVQQITACHYSARASITIPFLGIPSCFQSYAPHYVISKHCISEQFVQDLISQQCVHLNIFAQANSPHGADTTASLFTVPTSI